MATQQAKQVAYPPKVTLPHREVTQEAARVAAGTETGTNGGPGAKGAGAIDGTPGGAGGAGGGGGGGTPGSKLSPISLLLPILVSNCEHSIGATGGTVALGEGNKFKGGLGGDFGG